MVSKLNNLNRWLIRWKKRRNLLARTDAAFTRLWIKFQKMPVEEKSYHWLDRNHRRLMKIYTDLEK